MSSAVMPSNSRAGDVHGVLLLAVSSARAGRKRSRYSVGLAPTRRANARRSRLGGAEAGGAGDLVDREARSSRAGGARPRRARVSTYAAGVQPTSSRNTRAKWRGLIATRAASRSTRVVVVGMLGDPRLQLAQRIARRDLRAELRAELRLPARPLHEQHELARGRQRDVAAEVVVDEREREVHARGHAGRRPDVAVAHEDRIGVDGDVRVARARASSHARQCVVARRPSSRPAAASTNAPVHTDATRRLRRASRAHRTRRARRRSPRRSAPSPPTTTSVSIGPRTDASDRSATTARPRVVRSGPGSGAATSTRYASGSPPVRRATSRGGGEHLVRADEVERGDAGVDDEHDAAAHPPIVRPAPVWQQ